jgi:molecular chaperone HscB
MPAGFLAQQMQWREELDETRASPDKSRLRALAAEVDVQRVATLTRLEQALDQGRDFAAAAALVRQLMFVEKFSNELAALTDPAAANAG